jgi:hypothetical protein
MHVTHRGLPLEVIGYNCAGKWHKIFRWVCISFVTKVKYPVRSGGKRWAGAPLYVLWPLVGQFIQNIWEKAHETGSRCCKFSHNSRRRTDGVARVEPWSKWSSLQPRSSRRRGASVEDPSRMSGQTLDMFPNQSGSDVERDVWGLNPRIERENTRNNQRRPGHADSRAILETLIRSLVVRFAAGGFISSDPLLPPPFPLGQAFPQTSGIKVLQRLQPCAAYRLSAMSSNLSSITMTMSSMA